MRSTWSGCSSALPMPGSLVPLRVATIAAKRVLLSHAPDTGAAVASGSGWPAASLRVLVGGDNFAGGEGPGKRLSDWGYAARVCTLAGEALALAPYYRPHVVVVD